MQDPFAVFDEGSQSSAHVREGVSHSGMRAEALLREYQRALDATDRQIDLVIRTASIGFTVAGVLLGLAASARVVPPEWAIWLAPQFLVLVYSLILLFVWEIVYRSYYARDLENELSKSLDIDFLHYENNLARGLTSFSTGHPAHIVLYLMMILFGASLYVALIIVGLFLFRSDDVPTWRQALFLTVYLAFGLVLL